MPTSVTERSGIVYRATLPGDGQARKNVQRGQEFKTNPSILKPSMFAVSQGKLLEVCRLSRARSAVS